jgi:hypothetical protein
MPFAHVALEHATCIGLRARAVLPFRRTTDWWIWPLLLCIVRSSAGTRGNSFPITYKLVSFILVIRCSLRCSTYPYLCRAFPNKSATHGTHCCNSGNRGHCWNTLSQKWKLKQLLEYIFATIVLAYCYNNVSDVIVGSQQGHRINLSQH